MELISHGVQNLASAIAAVESLIEFNKESSKGQNKKISGSDKGRGDWDKSPRRDKPSTQKDKGKGKKDEAPRKYSCFLCNGPHRVFECPKQGKFSTLVQEEERQEQERTIAPMKLLNVIQVKVEGQPRRRIYVETIINATPLHAVLNTRAHTGLYGQGACR